MKDLPICVGGFHHREGCSNELRILDPEMKGEVLEGALVDLQMRLTHQDDEIRSLSQSVDRQRSEMDALKAEVDCLKKLVAVLAPAQVDEAQDETPPHY